MIRTGISGATWDQIQKELDPNDKEKLNKLLQTIQNRAKTRAAITEEADELIKKRIWDAIKRGSSWDYENIKSTLARIAKYGREGRLEDDKMPSNDAEWACRAQNLNMP